MAQLQIGSPKLNYIWMGKMPMYMDRAVLSFDLVMKEKKPRHWAEKSDPGEGGRIHFLQKGPWCQGLCLTFPLKAWFLDDSRRFV